MADKNIVVVRLGLHLEGMQPVYIQNDNVNAALESAQQKNTHLTAYFHYNLQHKLIHHAVDGDCGSTPCPLQLTYVDFPQQFRWMEKERVWKPRDKGGFNTISRLYQVKPQKDEELMCLRILLHNVKGATSFQNILTVGGFEHPPYKDACQALLLLDRDDIYELTLFEVANWCVPSRLRVFFAHTLFHCNLSDPLHLYARLRQHLLDDTSDDEVACENRALLHIASRLSYFNKSLADYGLPSPDEGRVHDMPQFDVDVERTEAERMSSLLNVDQRAVYEHIMAAVFEPESCEEPRCRAYFLDGPGGSGKTFLYNCLIHSLRAQGKVVCPVAWTGIASILLTGGTTSHSLFKFSVPLTNDSVCNISHQSKEAELLRACSLIIWDEAPMAPKHALHQVDALLRDITNNDRTKFGGKVLLLGGDFRQVLPVVQHGGRADQVNACIKNSPLWPSFRQFSLRVNMRADQGQEEFQDFLMRVGDGLTPPIADLPEDFIEVPSTMVLQDDADICSVVFGTEGLTEEVVSSRAILCPKK
ncbi:uncharacterized protein LOC134527212 isoform X2 [Bacillus rossius redtenbacheri]|uniref:uncharacterized protein LOC134527212 isoform X2 n=1 Tax=Bacillus rossius redtenbacheri TaxID=93214 RepID=UPI002FDDB4BB